MHRIYSRRSYIYNLFQNIERNSPVFAFCFTLDSWTILLFWQAQNLLQSMMKHYCADRRGKKWFIDSHPVHSNVLARRSVLSTCGVLKIFSILLTKNLLGPASHLAACSDASIQEQLWLAQFVFPPHTITVHLWTSSSEAYDNKNVPMEQKDKISSSSLSLFLTYLWRKLSKMYCLIRICNMQPDLLHHLFWLGFGVLFWIQVQGYWWGRMNGWVQSYPVKFLFSVFLCGVCLSMHSANTSTLAVSRHEQEFIQAKIEGSCLKTDPDL